MMSCIPSWIPKIWVIEYHALETDRWKFYKAFPTRKEAREYKREEICKEYVRCFRIRGYIPAEYF